MADPAEDEHGQNTPGISHQPEDDQQKAILAERSGDRKELSVRNPAPVDPTLQEAVEDPVEILVGLAERGEIDPWNIDIIEVTDRFLNELERRRQLNLQVSGRTLFYAATLLRMKSEHLFLQSDQEEPGLDEDDEIVW